MSDVSLEKRLTKKVQKKMTAKVTSIRTGFSFAQSNYEVVNHSTKFVKPVKSCLLLDDVLRELRVSASKIQELLKTFPKSPNLSWGNSSPEQVIEHRTKLREYAIKVWKWSREFERKVLKELVEPSSEE